jgi:hypothetical protein
MTVITDEDKINLIVIPESVDITYYENQYDLAMATGKNICGYADWLSIPGKCKIHAVRRSSVIEHELRHCAEGYWHSNMYYNEEC